MSKKEHPISPIDKSNLMDDLTDSLEVEEEIRKRDFLLEALLDKEADIKKLASENIQNKKKAKQISSSNTYKLFKPITKAKFSRGTSKEVIISELEEKLAEIQKELYSTKEKYHDLIIRDRLLNIGSLHDVLKEKKENGELISFLKQTIENKKQLDSNYNHMLRYIARLFMKEKEEYRDYIYQLVLDGLTMEAIPEFILREGLKDSPIELRQVSSFRASMNMRIRKMQLTGTLPEWQLDDKRNAYNFMDKLNVPIPWVAEDTYSISTIPKREGIVIKPANGAGSRGVYLVYSTTDIFDIKRSRNVKSWEGLLESLAKDLSSGWVEEDKWIIEELILENKDDKLPSRDIKFYCFYGRVGLILEISRYPELKYCWWTENGERVKTGKYTNDLFKGKGCTQAEVQLAKEISQLIPAPFIRIDFLRSDKGLVFGEFTPKPGNYDEFDEATDKWLGDYFNEAEGRLINDLLNGKEFSYFNEMIKTF
ncbi:ATP-grasp fold amidoligase family protein [Ornithinibacillus hominis]|nr:ATP-grasp fold amidoligase family protein [Ornithinibacillus hominis]